MTTIFALRVRALRLTTIALAAFTAAALATPAHAANLLTNGSFETVTGTFGGDGGQDLPVPSPAITGWTVVVNDVAPLQNGNPYGVTAEDGTTSLDLQSYADGSPYGGVQQVLSTVIGHNYVLTFYIGVQNSIGIAVGPASVRATADADGGNTTQLFTNTLTAPGMQWEQFAFPFTAVSALTNISLKGISTAGGGYIGLDNAVLNDLGAAPEPTTLALLSLALPTLLKRRARA